MDNENRRISNRTLFYCLNAGELGTSWDGSNLWLGPANDPCLREFYESDHSWGLSSNTGNSWHDRDDLGRQPCCHTRRLCHVPRRYATLIGWNRPFREFNDKPLESVRCPAGGSWTNTTWNSVQRNHHGLSMRLARTLRYGPQPIYEWPPHLPEHHDALQVGRLSSCSDRIGPTHNNWLARIACSLMNYILLFIAFIKLRLDHKKMARQFVNPLGIPSAVLGIGCMLAATVSLFTHAPLIT